MMGIPLLAQLPRTVHAAGRTPYGGVLRATCPWPLETLDPHRADNTAALFFGHAVFNPLYSVTPQGTPFPTLATQLPRPTTSGVVITLREGVQSFRGRNLDAHAVRYSLERAKRLDAHPFARRVQRVRASSPTQVAIKLQDAANFSSLQIARWLASPLLSIVPPGFSAASPDGSGPFGARIQPGAFASIHLSRNLRAARGASFLTSINLRGTSDLAEPLRRFESGQDNLGWLGRGLHSPRKNAKIVRSSALGWLILRTGNALGRWSRPGIAFELAQSVPDTALRALGTESFSSGTGDGYRGPRTSLLVPERHSQLTAIAQGLAESLNRESNSRVTVLPVPLEELRTRLSSRDFGLALTAERPLALGSHGVLPSLHSLAGTRAALRPHPPISLRSAVGNFCRTQPFTVLGTLEVQLGHTDEFAGLNVWDLGAVFRR